MRNILACIAAGVLILGGVGWYLGWFKFQSTPTPDGHREVKIDVDGKKAIQDIKNGEQKIEGLIHPKDNTKPVTVTPGGSSSLPPSPLNGSRFVVKDGVIVDTFGEVSAPVPIDSK
jgi:hypothetical protein